MTNSIIEELIENAKIMRELIEKQIFNVEDAEQFMKRYINIERSMEDLERSRDSWKKKFIEMKRRSNEHVKDK